MLTTEGVKPSQPCEDSLPDMPADLRLKAQTALKKLGSFRKVIIAFSGGVDSTLVAYLARMALGDASLAVTADSPSLPSGELEETKLLAKELGLRHMVIRTEELDDPNYAANPSNRCYFCKKELSNKLEQLASDLGFQVIVDGTNADDLHGHRPGAAALSERGVRRPLADVGMTKPEVRELSRLLGLPNHDKPSMPCLSSRVQYGQIITPERLLRIEKSENLIRSLTGVKQLRVRDHGNLARVEVGREERHLFFDEKLLDRLVSSLREFGFTYVTFDIAGYRTGSMNELLTTKTKRPVESTAVSYGQKR
jgi:uncharacterized protein